MTTCSLRMPAILPQLRQTWLHRARHVFRLRTGVPISSVHSLWFRGGMG